MALARDDILIHLRFFDMALARLQLKERWGTGCLATDGQTLFYDPLYVLRCYRENPKLVARAYLHMLLHCIFPIPSNMTDWTASCGILQQTLPWKT